MNLIPNPIAIRWFSHTPGAFEEARRQKKPILLDIGALWCHWCHEMDRENYHSSDIIKFINKHFIPIKIDRDQYPDLDNYYQTIVGNLVGVGGWPLTVFLTEEGYPFFGGTYYPREDQHGLIGYKTLLKQIFRNYNNNRQQLIKIAKKNSGKINKLITPEKAETLPDRGELEQFVNLLKRDFDSRYGGFDHSPKFPPHTQLTFLCQLVLNHPRKDSRDLTEMIEKTLSRMADGGIFDHIGGGFHRYTVDRKWRIPHFEKMLYDNALLIENYAYGYQLTNNQRYKKIIDETMDYYLRETSHLEKTGFFSSQDADQENCPEGAYYTWTEHELRQILSKGECTTVKTYFDIMPQGNMTGESERSTIAITKTIHQVAKETAKSSEQVEKNIQNALKKMKKARQKRQKPYIDTTVYVSWNALMIKGLLVASEVLHNQKYLKVATSVLDNIITNAKELRTGCFRHTLSHQTSDILLEDNAYLLEALIKAYQVTNAARYLNMAIDLFQAIQQTFWNKKIGLFQQNRQNARMPSLYPILDMPLPGANPVMAFASLELAAITKNTNQHHNVAEQILKSSYLPAKKAGHFATTYWLAHLFHLNSLKSPDL